MSCPIEVGDRFEWQEDYKRAFKGGIVEILSIRVDEDCIPQVRIMNCHDRTQRITAEDIHIRVNEGRLERL